MRCLPESSVGLKALAQDGLGWLDGQLDGKAWICGDQMSDLFNPGAELSSHNE